MASRTPRLVARLMWLVPALLLVLTVNQIKAALDIRATLQGGEPAVAEVLEIEKSDRVDVTYDYVSLRVELDGRVYEQERMSLPHTLAPRIVGKDVVDVRVMPGAAQPIVITELAATQWRIAAINAGIAFVGLLIAFAGVFAWNRYLARQGDPAERPAEDTPGGPAGEA